MKDNEQRVTDATEQAICTKTAPGGEERERDEPNNTNKSSWADVASRREGVALDPPGDMEVGAATAEMATLETKKNKDENIASPREEHLSVPRNHQTTAEVQQVRRDERDSTEKRWF
jgi:hypothetical protein